MDWLISANGKIYDHASAFEKWGFIDWKQGKFRYSVGDVVYIYCSDPVYKIQYKTIVTKNNLTKNEIVNDKEFWHDETKYYDSLDGCFMRLKLIAQVNKEELKYKILLKNGLKSAPQGALKLSVELKKYIENYFDVSFNEDIYPDLVETEECFEGAKSTISVNRYERNPIARKKCIELKSCNCHICKMNFEDFYGEIGKDFIHVHHIVPLNQINESYNVNPATDLLPVCPNCHAMLHRKINNKYLSPDELRNIINQRKN